MTADTDANTKGNVGHFVGRVANGSMSSTVRVDSARMVSVR